MSDDWKGIDKLKGIRRPNAEGNGYNLKKAALAKRVADAKAKLPRRRAADQETDRQSDK